MKKIICDRKGNKFLMLFDKQDLNLVLGRKWFVIHKRDRCYAATGRHLYFHHLIFPHKIGFVNDHINNNPLDNRRCNLRYLTNAQNIVNGKIRKNNKSGITGVYKRKDIGTYVAQFTENRKTFILGNFKTLSMAVRARKNYENKLFGEG